jgi:hypothetical protein
MLSTMRAAVKGNGRQSRFAVVTTAMTPLAVVVRRVVSKRKKSGLF